MWCAFAARCGAALVVSVLVARVAHAEAEIVKFSRAEFTPGSIVIVNRERRLYFVGPDGEARRYPVAIGTEDEQWTGREIVTDKKENPRWIEPDEDGEGQVVEGGDPGNPLGKRALYLGHTLWRIHGTVAPNSIGKAVSNGCIRMHNTDVIDLYERVAPGTEVFVINAIGEAKPQAPGRKLAGD